MATKFPRSEPTVTPHQVQRSISRGRRCVLTGGPILIITLLPAAHWPHCTHVRTPANMLQQIKTEVDMALDYFGTLSAFNRGCRIAAVQCDFAGTLPV